MKKTCITILIVSLFYGLSSAKPANSTGIGFNSQLTDFNISSISIRHWTSDKLAFEGLVGFTLGDDTVFNAGIKALRSMKEEPNLTLYGFGLFGMEYVETASNNIFNNDNSDTSTKVGAGFGVEFFLNGLPNLGFGAETGFGFSNANDKSQFGIMVGWLSTVGIRYYL